MPKCLRAEQGGGPGRRRLGAGHKGSWGAHPLGVGRVEYDGPGTAKKACPGVMWTSEAPTGPGMAWATHATPQLGPDPARGLPSFRGATRLEILFNIVGQTPSWRAASSLGCREAGRGDEGTMDCMPDTKRARPLEAGTYHMEAPLYLLARDGADEAPLRRKGQGDSDRLCWRWRGRSAPSTLPPSSPLWCASRR